MALVLGTWNARESGKAAAGTASGGGFAVIQAKL